MAQPATAATCTVPGSHAAIHAAVFDPTCTTIQLQAQTYDESVQFFRSLTLQGPGGGGALLRGGIVAAGATTSVSLVDFAVESSCPQSLRSAGGARLVGEGLQVVRSSSAPCPLFAPFQNGFESGNTLAWSATAP